MCEISFSCCVSDGAFPAGPSGHLQPRQPRVDPEDVFCEFRFPTVDEAISFEGVLHERKRESKSLLLKVAAPTPLSRSSLKGASDAMWLHQTKADMNSSCRGRFKATWMVTRGLISLAKADVPNNALY